MKKENTLRQVGIWGILLLVSVFCITYYNLELLLTGATSSENKNMGLYIIVALPFLYLSTGVIVGLMVQYWSNIYISKKLRNYLIACAICFMFIFVAILIAFKTPTSPSRILQGISYYSALFTILGILMSIGLSCQTSRTE